MKGITTEDDIIKNALKHTRLKGGLYVSANETSYDWPTSYDSEGIVRTGFTCADPQTASQNHRLEDVRRWELRMKEQEEERRRARRKFADAGEDQDNITEDAEDTFEEEQITHEKNIKRLGILEEGTQWAGEWYGRHERHVAAGWHPSSPVDSPSHPSVPSLDHELGDEQPHTVHDSALRSTAREFGTPSPPSSTDVSISPIPWPKRPQPPLSKRNVTSSRKMPIDPEREAPGDDRDRSLNGRSSSEDSESDDDGDLFTRAYHDSVREVTTDTGIAAPPIGTTTEEPDLPSGGHSQREEDDSERRPGKRVRIQSPEEDDSERRPRKNVRIQSPNKDDSKRRPRKKGQIQSHDE
ncbi:hypothetical protein K504DRAFT_459603 [Pleomassaria siparia CBS 279.74]|uniref:Uncharacterized protein n=1 Tax=Pleomassaria siparia CBS 279.74 TaxID=1314801 RepID=A0A6G1K0B3_9PLEO|nr:hypothetical protein K504DRAFT_459603 [Pleomassaria siparia CBS 279.74]